MRQFILFIIFFSFVGFGPLNIAAGAEERLMDATISGVGGDTITVFNSQPTQVSVADIRVTSGTVEVAITMVSDGKESTETFRKPALQRGGEFGVVVSGEIRRVVIRFVEKSTCRVLLER